MVKPYDRNAKKHPDSQLKLIAASLREFGWRQPIVVDKNDVIIVGHGRWLAYQKYPEGIKEPRIEKADDLTPEQVKAYRLADNRLNESDWAMDMVKDELRELSPEMFALTGFSQDLIIDPDENDDVVPDNPPAQSKLGDLYQLGAHRVLCGDSTSPEAVLSLVGGVKADMVFTDPPYNVNYKATKEYGGQRGIMGDKQTESQFDEFLDKTFRNYEQNTKQGSGIYVFHSTSTAGQFKANIEKTGILEVKQQLIWNKPNLNMGWSDYRWKHEPFYYIGFKGIETKFYGDRTHSTIIDFQKSDIQLANWAKRIKKLEKEGKTTIWTMKRDGTGNTLDYLHPTQKPVELITYALINSSKAEDIVMDLFLGSGSTMIAAEKTNRICYGMELDPKFVDVIVQRYVNYTGNENIIKNGEKIVWKKK